MVRRRFSDFEELFRQLREQTNPALLEHLSLPSKHNITMGFSNTFLDKRMRRLEQFLKDLLGRIDASEVLIVEFV